MSKQKENIVTSQNCCQNTDKEIWRKEPNDYYSPSIHVTQENNIGINVGGTVIIRSVEEWHNAFNSRLISSTPEPAL